MGADFKRVDADIQSTGLSLLEIERSARYASFAFADLDDARAVTMRLADSARKRLSTNSPEFREQVDTQADHRGDEVGRGLSSMPFAPASRGIDAVAEQLRGLEGDVDVRLIRDAFKVSLEDAEYLKVLGGRARTNKLPRPKSSARRRG